MNKQDIVAIEKFINPLIDEFEKFSLLLMKENHDEAMSAVLHCKYRLYDELQALKKVQNEHHK